MDKLKANVFTILAQPLVHSDENTPYGVPIGLSDVAVSALRMMERMVDMSEGVIKAAEDKEAYETIIRHVEGLHKNLGMVAECANLALKQHGFYKD